MAGYTRCPDCEGSIPSYTGVCVDCGFDLGEFCNGAEELHVHPPVEVYEEHEHFFEHEDPFDHLDWTG